MDSVEDREGGGYYQITVRGALDPGWAAWFDGMRLGRDAAGNTTVGGRVADQAGLYGLISKARDLGLTLLAVTCEDRGPPPSP